MKIHLVSSVGRVSLSNLPPEELVPDFCSDSPFIYDLLIAAMREELRPERGFYVTRMFLRLPALLQIPWHKSVKIVGFTTRAGVRWSAAGKVPWPFKTSYDPDWPCLICHECDVRKASAGLRENFIEPLERLRCEMGLEANQLGAECYISEPAVIGNRPIPMQVEY